MLPTNSAGHFVYSDRLLEPANMETTIDDQAASRTLPTDDGQRETTTPPPPPPPLPTTTVVPITSVDVEASDDSQTLPTDDTREDEEAESSTPLTPLTDADGSPYPTDDRGALLDNLATAAGESDEEAHVLPTDDGGKRLYPIVNAAGELLIRDVAGHFLDENGNRIATDDFGRPLNADGQTLPTTGTNRFIYVEPTLAVAATEDTPHDANADRQLLPTDGATEKEVRKNKVKRNNFI